jgi:hypothetical protein
MSVAARNGLKVVAIPDAPPPWATSNWNVGPTTESAVAAYGAFVRSVLERYGSNGTFWSANPSLPKTPIENVDIWNEPYAPMFWSSGFPDPSAYARLFKAAVLAARSADPRAKFMLEADTASYAPGEPAFLSAMFDAVPDLAAYADSVSVHPYTIRGWGPTYCTPSPAGTTPDWHRTRYQACRIFDIRRILDAHGGAHVKIWITELGWSTASGDIDSVSEATQAEYVRRTFEQLRGSWRGTVSGMLLYSYQTREAVPGLRNDFFGLVHADGTPKPAWDAFVAEVRRGT